MRTSITLIAIAFFLAVASPVLATQDPAQEFPADPIEQLRLTPEQRQRIRVILEQNKPERQSTNRRLREANVALDQALDADPVNESVVEQRVNEVAAAQTAQLRMRIDTEIKIRRELRPEQLAVLRRLRLQIRDVVGPQRPANTFTQRPGRNIRRP
ncbi:MAG TPA: periplasmic heavy metal sensor [Pyrinomonadaceae bacterium]|nr:periplasmic heavy metal sensor [Pyrinomonadaceae bacterium]